MKNKRGISLITLVITIIIIIILAAVIIINMNSNNLITKADEAVFANDVDSYKSELYLYIVSKVSDENIYNPKLLNGNKNSLKYNGIDIVDESGKNLTMKDAITSMKKEHVDKFIIFEGELVYIGEIKSAEINIKLDINVWTNGDVVATFSYDKTLPAGYVIQYKVGNGEWITGTNIKLTENTTIKGRLYNTNLNDEVAVNSVDVTNIDKTAPTEPTTITKTTNINSIVVKASGSTDIGSGVVGYEYSKDNITWSETIEPNVSYTFDGIKAGTSVTVYARAIDKVGLISSVKNENIATIKPTDKIEFSLSTNEITIDPVIVTLSYPNQIPNGYIIQYKVGTDSWTTGTSVKLTVKNTVKGRLYNSLLDDEIALNSIDVTNIDDVIYTISKIGSSYGDFTPSKTGAKAGEVITLTLSPKADYKVIGIKVNGTNLQTGVKTFTMPASNVNVEVLFQYRHVGGNNVHWHVNCHTEAWCDPNVCDASPHIIYYGGRYTFHGTMSYRDVCYGGNDAHSCISQCYVTDY